MLPVAGLLLAAAVSSPVPDAGRHRLQVDMTVGENVALGKGSLRAIAAEVQRIWAPALELRVSVGTSAVAGAVDTLRVQITNSTRDGGESTGLGWIVFDEGEPRREATVSLGAARRLLQGATWMGTPFAQLPVVASTRFLERALAQALAHEIGHYVFRSSAHEHRGLMRARFTADEIMDPRPEFVRLADTAVARLRNGGLVAQRTCDRPTASCD